MPIKVMYKKKDAGWGREELPAKLICDGLD